jgi:glycosyltransferase involved in cell wall biosynthesis
VRIACISLSPVPYNTPILNALAGRVDLHTIYLCSEDLVGGLVDTWGEEPRYDHSFFRSKSLHSQRLDLQLQLSIGITRRLAALSPDVVLVVSWKPAMVEPLVWARLSGRGSVMWSESTSFSGLFRGPISNRFRRAVVAGVDSFVTNGSQATAYLHALGVRPDRVVTGLLPGATGAVPSPAARAPGAEGVHFLYVGRLIPRKRPVELIRAFERVVGEAPRARLTIVGQGELEREVGELAARAPWLEYVGFAQGDELASVYAQADVLVLPALREVWGLVVNEALAHGLFVIATDEVGSAYDLLDERSGAIVPAHDLEQLARTMTRTAATLDRSDAARLQRAASVSNCTPERFAADIEQAAELAVRVKQNGSPRRRRAR